MQLPPGDSLPAAPDLPPERRAIQVVGTLERTVDAEAARARGLTVVDLSDAWVPSVLDDHAGAKGATLVNPYHAIYTGLAADRTDGDGQPLAAGERNYLEMYGIPPALSVLRRRFLEDARRNCGSTFDPEKLLAVDEVRSWGASSEVKELGKQAARASRLEAARLAAGAASLEALAAAQPRTAKDVQEHLRFVAERAAFVEAEKRLVCEGLLEPAKHKSGAYDTAMRTAMLAFQQKQAVMDQADIKRGTLEALARPPLENDLLALRRVLTERAMHAASFLEDGSVSDDDRPGGAVGGPTYRGADGGRHQVPDLATPSLAAVLLTLGIETPDDAVAFFRRHPRADFAWLKVAARLPPAPEYYGPAMDLAVEIDRGDVWYDFPFDAKGQRVPQPRERFPTFTLYVKWRGEKVPLVRWRTTVGGWRVELASDGQEYYRYKGSDVGPRVWHHIVAAPVWIPAPVVAAHFLRERKAGQRHLRSVSPTTTRRGPGICRPMAWPPPFTRRCGAVPTGRPSSTTASARTDRSITCRCAGASRTAVTASTTSRRCACSASCSGTGRCASVGAIPLGFRRAFYSQGEVFEMRLPSRGFYYELEPPLPVDVLEGTVKGTLQKPIAGYVPKPGVKYASSKPPTAATSPDSRAGGDTP